MAGMTLDEIKNFIKEQNVLIIDPSNSTRKVLKLAMSQLGVPLGNIRATSYFNEAVQYILEAPPRIIFTEFKIRDRFGLELLPYLNQFNINHLDRCFFVVTENSHETSVARAAEEDVDGYIVKPFTIESLNTYLIETIKEKIHPSEYYQKIEQAKKLMENSRVNEAVTVLSEAAKDAVNPSLAHYYLGQCYRLLGQKENALKQYRLGLEYQKNHYKCSVGEFEVLDELGQQAEAYTVGKRLAANYPLTTNRLGRLLTLAVYTRHLEDLPNYFELFLKIENRPEDLVKIVSASMFVCAKYFLSQKKYPESLAFFKKACIVSLNRNDMVTKSIESYLAVNRPSEALDLIKMVSVEDRQDSTWKGIEFKILCYLETPQQLLERGRKLISEEIKLPFVYTKVASIYLSLNKERHAENVIYDGIKNCPDHREELLKVLESRQ